MEGEVLVQLKAPIDSYTREVFCRLWEDPAKDCVIYCQDGQLKVHMAVLACISPVFRDSGPLEETVGLSLPEISLSQVSALVKLLYLGTATITKGTSDLIKDVVRNFLQTPMDIVTVNIKDTDHQFAGYTDTYDDGGDDVDHSSLDSPDQTCHQSINTSLTSQKNLNSLDPPNLDAITLYLKPKRKHCKRNLPEQANVNYQEAIKILICGVCGITTENFYPLMKKHYETVHYVRDEKTYYCPTQSCNKKIASTNSFHSHIHIVHREASHHCEHCTKKFKTSGSLAHHTARWHTSDRPLVCQECGEGMASALHLEAHMRMHKSKHICSVCRKKFLSASHLEKHKVTHTSDRPYMCGTCGKTFRDPYSVKECEMKHQGIKKLKPSQLIPWRNREAKFVCDTCGYRTKGKAALDRHIKGKHSKDRPFHCKECGKDFKSGSNLESHKTLHGKSKSENMKSEPAIKLVHKAQEFLENKAHVKVVDIEKSSNHQDTLRLHEETSRSNATYFWMPHSSFIQPTNL